MISAIYLYDNKITKNLLAAPKAQLPVKMRSGNLELITWGRREQEPVMLPIGGNLQYKHLQQGNYDQYFPKHCKIIVSEYQLQRDIGNEWHSLTNKQFIHGVVLKEGHELRLYVVTITGREIQNHFLLPRILFHA